MRWVIVGLIAVLTACAGAVAAMQKYGGSCLATITESSLNPALTPNPAITWKLISGVGMGWQYHFTYYADYLCSGGPLNPAQTCKLFYGFQTDYQNAAGQWINWEYDCLEGDPLTCGSSGSRRIDYVIPVQIKAFTPGVRYRVRFLAAPFDPALPATCAGQ